MVYRGVAIVLLTMLIGLPGSADRSASFVPAQLPPVGAGGKIEMAVVLYNGESRAWTGRLSLTGGSGMVMKPAQRSFRIEPGSREPVFFHVRFAQETDRPKALRAVVNGRAIASLPVAQCYDLAGIRWKARLDRDGTALRERWFDPAFDDSAWSPTRIPGTIQDNGVTYLRARLFIPNSWRGKPVRLKLAAVDDNDVTYLNGVEIGRTEGWDRPRDYRIPEKLIRFGHENLLCIAVINPTAGGGIYRSPNLLGVEFAPPGKERVVKMAPSGKIGPSLPLRRMHVEGGVLRYPDGREVALWGINYYPQSWYQFENMKKLGLDMKAAVRRDLDDMQTMGVEAIRIHVFDREISDRHGNLLDNEHLDLLDYLISEGSKRGIYFFFTPIAWWPGPNENPDSFSARTPKEAMCFSEEAIKAEESYLRNWLLHRNRYTGLLYRDEPAICVLEIMNEPAYWDYNDLATPGDESFKAELNALWRRWCDRQGCSPDPSLFGLFRTQLQWSYLSRMHRAVRSTGAKQPLAASLVSAGGHDDLLQAIADSPCEAVTTGDYLGDWNLSGDERNLLDGLGNASLDPRFNGKARLVYEFDAIKCLSSYLYPAFARRYRSMGVQIACNFQYDSSTTARFNSDWDAHYLNLEYTPSKAVSFRIAREVFHALPRGATYPTPPDNQRFGPCAVSYQHNISLFASPDLWMNSAPVGEWQPLSLPKRPRKILGVGSSPFVSYEGTGSYSLGLEAGSADLLIRPDVHQVDDPWRGVKVGRPVMDLQQGRHFLSLHVPGIRVTRVLRLDPEGTSEVPVESNRFEAVPGRYRLEWQQTDQATPG